MNTGSIRPGDVVRCDVQGVTFHGIVETNGKTRSGELAVDPIERGFTSPRFVTARQIVDHWRARRTRSSS